MKRYSISLLISAVICAVACVDDFVYPCGSKIELPCVQDYLKSKSSCVVVNKKPIYRENLLVPVPTFNITAVLTQTYLSEMDGEFETFYLNKKTGNLVMSVKFRGFHVEAPDTIIAVQQKGKEPKVVIEKTNFTYPATFTAVIPASNSITHDSLMEGHYSAYLPEAFIPVYIGPKFMESEDPVIKAAAEALKNDVTTALRENFNTFTAAYFFLAYLQNYVCDFDFSPVLKEYDTTVFSSASKVNVDDSTFYTKPCIQHTGDITQCVVKYLQEHSACAPARVYDDTAVIAKTFYSYVPSNNCTAIYTNAVLSGLNGRIEEFYINEKTSNLIISVAFEELKLNSGLTKLIANQRGMEPNIVTDSSYTEYPSVTLTAVIPKDKGQFTSDSLKKSFVTPYFAHLPRFPKIGTKFTETTDPQIVEIVKLVGDHPARIGQELFTTKAYGFFLAYLQENLCNFGIPMTSFP